MGAEQRDHVKEPKTVGVIINGRARELTKKDELTYEELVGLAFNNNPPTGPNIVITVTFTRGDDARREGSLLPGDSVKVKNGMIFNVTATDKS